MSTQLAVLWSLCLTLTLTTLSCDESLPAYNDPSELIESRGDALYVISITDNSLKVYVNLVNTYDETFDDRAFIDGTVTVTWTSVPSFRKTFIVTSSNILSGKYNASSQQLRMDPGDTLKFAFSWDLIDDIGGDIRDLTLYYEDQSCAGRFLSDPLTFMIRSEVKVYEKIASAVAPAIPYTFVHHREWFHPKDCVPR